jgi:thiamine transport system substrate-binding protein
LRIVSYSAFVSTWGPGPEIARRFEKETGIKVEFNDAGDAGVILKKLELFPADLALGFDQLTLGAARSARPWRDLSKVIPRGMKWAGSDFIPFDWAPMAFIYRRGEIEPPTSLDDLLSPRFKGAIALEDPRTSTPGLQFLFWVLDEKGVDKGFEYLKNLKPNIQSVADNWSATYGLFTKKQAKLAFSYLTSPVYHWVQESDETYQAAVFAGGHPVQVEYVGVPQSCVNCDAAERFALYLLKPEIQKVIMEKNYMFPVVSEVTSRTPFAKVPAAPTRDWKSLTELLQNREQLFERWRDLGL